MSGHSIVSSLAVTARLGFIACGELGFGAGCLSVRI
jgi:hypothetical protein